MLDSVQLSISRIGRINCLQIVVTIIILFCSSASPLDDSLLFCCIAVGTATPSKYLYECDLWPRVLDWPQTGIRVCVWMSAHPTPSVCSQSQNHGPSSTTMCPCRPHVRSGMFSQFIINIKDKSTSLTLVFYSATGFRFHHCGQKYCWVLHERI